EMSARSKAKKMRSPAVAARSCCEPGPKREAPSPPGPTPPGPPGGVSGVLLQAASSKNAPATAIKRVNMVNSPQPIGLDVPHRTVDTCDRAPFEPRAKKAADYIALL